MTIQYTFALYASSRHEDPSMGIRLALEALRSCTAFGDKEGWTYVETYADPDVRKAGYPDFERLLIDAEAGRMDIVVVRSLDDLPGDDDIAKLYGTKAVVVALDVWECMPRGAVKILFTNEMRVERILGGVRAPIDYYLRKARGESRSTNVIRMYRGRTHREQQAEAEAIARLVGFQEINDDSTH